MLRATRWSAPAFFFSAKAVELSEGGRRVVTAHRVHQSPVFGGGCGHEQGRGRQIEVREQLNDEAIREGVLGACSRHPRVRFHVPVGQRARWQAQAGTASMRARAPRVMRHIAT